MQKKGPNEDGKSAVAKLDGRNRNKMKKKLPKCHLRWMWIMKHLVYRESNMHSSNIFL